MYEQLSIFDFINQTNGKYKFPNNKVIRLIELFGGVGSQAMAMERLNPPQGWESWRLVEYDKYPIASYNAIHNSEYVPTDITKIHGWDLGIVDKDKYSYLLCYSFPCQDISQSGHMRGFNKEKQKEQATRSGLLWQVERLLDETPLLPDVLICENVSNITSQSMMPDLRKWLSYLESKGYSNYWQVMNACDYGVAQSRKRFFCVSILGNYSYKFPEPIPLEKRMKDYLEPVVDEKYYIKTDKARDLINKLIIYHNNPHYYAGGAEGYDLIGNIERYGNANANYLPFDEAISYPLQSQDFVRTGFWQNSPTIAARDYKDPKNVCEVKKITGETT